MLSVLNRIWDLGIVIADYLSSGDDNRAEARSALIESINAAIESGEHPLTMDLVISDLLCVAPEFGVDAGDFIVSVLQERKNILGNNVNLSDEFVQGMYGMSIDNICGANITPEKYAELVELAKTAPERVRNMAMRSIMNNIVIMGKYRDSAYRSVLTEAISYAKQIKSEEESYYEGTRCDFWNF